MSVQGMSLDSVVSPSFSLNGLLELPVSLRTLGLPNAVQFCTSLKDYIYVKLLLLHLKRGDIGEAYTSISYKYMVESAYGLVNAYRLEKRAYRGSMYSRNASNRHSSRAFLLRVSKKHV